MRVLITGITGQDGSILAEQLVARGDTVFGMVRGQNNPKREWLQTVVPGAKLLDGDLTDQSALQDVVKRADPDVIYNMAALTFVGMSWQQPALMTETTGLGVLRLLEAVRHVNPDIRVVQASSSEQFGASMPPQTEKTMFLPRSPYGVAKTMAHHTVVNYRESYGMHASTAIMFNHTSTRRGGEFVERKVSIAAARIKRGLTSTLSLGNLSSVRDWGWAPDYMGALPLIAARDEPGDFCISTGKAHSVADMVKTAFKVVGLDSDKYVTINPDLFRPADVEYLQGWPTFTYHALGWKASVFFEEIMERLVRFDLERLSL